ncbi:MAG: helix-turn-helix transcriptional regulator [Spirochaetes bacterium]|nr:helix-turn-helix transcriptional regulator [Spirochaetota bacterium]
MRPHTISQISIAVDVRPLYCGYPHHPKGWREERAHAAFDLWVITHGSVRIVMNRRAETVREGDIFLIPPNTPYAAGNVSDEAAFQYMHFDIVLGGNRSLVTPAALAGRYAAATVRAERTVYSNAFMRNREGGAMAGLALRGALTMLISRMMALRLHRGGDEPEGRDYDRLRPVLDHIAWHANERLSNNALAEIACMTGSYFIRYFRSTMGVTPKRYIDRMTMERAREMLGDFKTVREVASILNFPDQFTFSKRFKKIFGVSPSEYLQTHRSSGAKRQSPGAP